MLLRLLLALTIALLPMPAVAACHVEQPAPEVMTHHGHHEGMDHAPAKKAPPAAEQLCIGCVAPATARTPQFAPPPAFTRADVPGEALSGIELAQSPPATPPPKP